MITICLGNMCYYFPLVIAAILAIITVGIVLAAAILLTKLWK